MDEKIAILKKYMDDSRFTVVATGAGISYLYGMRRLKQTVGQRKAHVIFSSKYVRKHPESAYKELKNAFFDATFIKGPSKVHKQLAKLEEEGKVSGIVTQNLDCLHEVAGSKNVIAFHGSFADNICVDCGNRVHDYTIWNQGVAPRCEKCGAPMMIAGFCSDTLSYEKDLQASMERAARMVENADLLIVTGTTGFLSENYLKYLRADTKLVQINPSATMFDTMADLNIRREAAEVFDDILS